MVVESLSYVQLLRLPGLWPTRILCPWYSPGKNTGVGSLSLLQGIFLTQGSNPGLPHCRQIPYYMSHQGSPCSSFSFIQFQKLFIFCFSQVFIFKLSLSSNSQFSSVVQSCPTLCDPMNRSTPRLPVHHQLLEFTQTHIQRVTDAIQPSHPLSSPSLPAPNPSQHQSLLQWVNSSHEVAKVLEFQL